MMQSVLTAGSGLSSQQARLDNIANNIANVNTNGFKSTRIDFKDALYTTMESPITSENQNDLEKGVGALIGATYEQFSQGAVKETGEPLDFAIEGNGFFTLQSGDGNTVYTRNGNFAVTHEASGSYLVNSDGDYVMDTAGNRISVSGDGENLEVNSDGVISENNQVIGQMNIVNFANPEGLDTSGESNWKTTAESGNVIAADGKVMQGSLEGSNVELAQEMTLLIRTQRAYSLASRALTTADEMDGLANNMRN